MAVFQYDCLQGLGGLSEVRHHLSSIATDL